MGLLLLQRESHAVLVAAILIPQYLDNDPVYSLPADTQAPEEYLAWKTDQPPI